jgi:ribulose-phosphate 3-epimerase
MEVQVLPSLLAADVGRLAEEARRAEAAGADALHLYIMDGHFVPNLSFGPEVAAMARRTVRLPLNVHLMLTNPDRYAARFIAAGAHDVLIHVEAPVDVRGTLAAIRAAGAGCGVTLNPGSAAEAAYPYLASVDFVLCMSVEPGYGGQAFIADVPAKIARIRLEAGRQGRADLRIMVDGGINRETAAACAAHGANFLVAGSSLFGAVDMAAEIRALRQAAARAYGRDLDRPEPSHGGTRGPGPRG